MAVNPELKRPANTNPTKPRLSEVPNDVGNQVALRKFLTDVRNHLRTAQGDTNIINNNNDQAAGDSGLHRFDVPLTVGYPAAVFQATGSIRLGATFEVLRIKVTHPCRIRLYSTAAARDADLSRTTSVQPNIHEAHGCILDLNLTSAYVYPLTWQLSPTAPGCNLESTLSDSIAYTIDTEEAPIGSGWVGFGSPNTYAFRMSTAVAVYVLSPAAGTLVRFSTTWGAPATTYIFYAVDNAGNILAVYGQFPNNAPVNTYVQGLVPVGATKLVAWSGVTIDPNWDGNHFSNLSGMSFQKAASMTMPTDYIVFTVLRTEKGGR